MYFPSTDQSESTLFLDETIKGSSAPDPSANLRKISLPVFFTETYATHLLSGDQMGKECIPGSKVKRVCTPRVRS